MEEVEDSQLVCQTAPSNSTSEVEVQVFFGKAVRNHSVKFGYRDDPVITEASPSESFYA